VYLAPRLNRITLDVARKRERLSHDAKLVRVFATSEMARCAFVKSLLDRERIDYFVKNETKKNVLGWAPTGWIDLWPAEFWVRSEDAERARALLRDLDEQRNAEDSEQRRDV
jgi:putative signal transducing protein